MPKQLLTIALLLLTLIGQTAAYASTYDMHGTNTNMPAMADSDNTHDCDHCDNTAPANTATSAPNNDCQSDCQCAQQCSSSQVLINLSASYPLLAIANLANYPPSFFHSLQKAPLFRPPISA